MMPIDGPLRIITENNTNLLPAEFGPPVVAVRLVPQVFFRTIAGEQ
jgi:hypothetical protein